MTRAPYDPRETLPAVSEVVPDALYLGRRPDTYAGFSLVVSCEEHLARKPMEGFKGVTLHCPMRDEDDFEINETLVRFAAGAVTNCMIDARAQRCLPALVHCTGGLNRSAVVAARALEWWSGCEPSVAVELLRKSRDQYVLCNRQFERWVLREQLPTAETSMFRETT